MPHGVRPFPAPEGPRRPLLRLRAHRLSYPAAIDEPVEGYARVNGVRLHFREWPHAGAPALVLTQSWPTTVLVWSRFAAAMQDRFRVIALDLRGHGDSDWAADYSWRTVVDDVDAFLRERVAAPATIVGHGGGGILTLCFAATRPALVRRVVNVDQMPMPRGAGSAKQLFHEVFDDPDEPARILAEKHWADRGDPELLRASMRRAIKPLDGRWTWRRDPRVADAYFERTIIPDEDESWALFATIRCPTLLVRGADTFGPRERYDRAAGVIPDARVAEVVGSRHLPHLSNPDAFLATVRPFLLAADSSTPPTATRSAMATAPSDRSPRQM